MDTFEQEENETSPDLWKNTNSSEAFENLKEQIEKLCTPLNAQEYLSLESTNKERLTSLSEHQLSKEPMSPNCISCIVIPAHNEETNIQQTLTALLNQTFSPDSNLTSENFEILIVNNNSTDKTTQKIEEWLLEHPTGLTVRTINVTFQSEEASAGSARKLGTDLEILRALNMQRNFEELYFIGLDADNAGIPTDHLEKVVTTFRQTNAKVLGGSVEFDSQIYRDIFKEKPQESLIESFLEYEKSIKKVTKSQQNKPIASSTCGANHAIEWKWYMQIRGYPPKRKTGEDTYIGRATQILGENITNLDSTIVINPRRMLLNPKAYSSGAAWDPESFADNNARVRNGEINLEMTDAEIIEAITRTLDDFASNVLETNGVSWVDAIVETRAIFNKICESHNVPIELRPSTDLFYVPAKKLLKMFKKGDAFNHKKGQPTNKTNYKAFTIEENKGTVTVKRLREIDDNSENIVLIKTNQAGIPEIIY